MRIISRIWLLLLTITIACSDDADKIETNTPGDDKPCNELPTGLWLEKTSGFTGGTVTISGKFPCLSGIDAVHYNGTTVEIVSKESGKIIIRMPRGMAGQGTFEVIVGDEAVKVPQEITVYPGSGTLKEIASFPGETRRRSQFFSADGRAYLIGGERVLEYPADKKFYTDIYEYDPATNQWSLIADQTASFFRLSQGFYSNGKYYFQAYPGDRVFDPATKTLSNAEKVPGSTYGFYLNDIYYRVEAGFAGSDPGVEIYQYSTATNSYERVAKEPRMSTSVSAFTYKGKAYIGILTLHAVKDRYNFDNNNMILMEFDPSTNTISEKATIVWPNFLAAFHSSYLFTIGNQAYFSAGSADGISNTIFPLTNWIMIYNFDTNDWFSFGFDKVLSEPMGFSIDNRAFLGMGYINHVPLLDYDTRFYEFIPE